MTRFDRSPQIKYLQNSDRFPYPSVLSEKNQLQYLVTDSLSTHLFLDLGNVFLRHESLKLSDIRSGTGAGFQYLSPIGPIGFDVGHPLDRQRGESNLQFHFSVGSAF